MIQISVDLPGVLTPAENLKINCLIDFLNNYKNSGIKPDDIKPDDIKPDDIKPDDIKPDDIKPDDIKPDDIKPDDIKPDDIKPDDIKPDDGERDSDGVRWDQRIHSSTKAKTKSGQWRKQRGIDEELYSKITQELKNEEVINEEAINEEAINEEAINEEAINEEAINEEAINEEAINEELIMRKDVFLQQVKNAGSSFDPYKLRALFEDFEMEGIEDFDNLTKEKFNAFMSAMNITFGC